MRTSPSGTRWLIDARLVSALPPTPWPTFSFWTSFTSPYAKARILLLSSSCAFSAVRLNTLAPSYATIPAAWPLFYFLNWPSVCSLLIRFSSFHFSCSPPHPTHTHICTHTPFSCSLLFSVPHQSFGRFPRHLLIKPYCNGRMNFHPISTIFLCFLSIFLCPVVKWQAADTKSHVALLQENT